MRIRLATLLASWLLVLSACGSDGKFTIVDVEYPTPVVSDDEVPDPTRIHWSGDSTFPVEFVSRVLPNTCPDNSTCAEIIVEFAESENPLVGPSFSCFGVTEEVVFEYEIVLIDANGVSTEPYPTPLTCLPR